MPRNEERRVSSFIVEGVPNKDIPYRLRNFAGEERKDPVSGIVVNNKGERNFCLFLNPELAKRLRADGWNVRDLKAREEGDEPQAFISVKVGFKAYPPKVVVINSSGNKHIMSEDELYQINSMEIEFADIKIRPRLWESQGKKGIKAYLQSIYITLAEDELDKKYSNVPASAAYQPVEEENPFN